MPHRTKAFANISELVTWIYMLPRKSFAKAPVIASVEEFFRHFEREHQNVVRGLKFLMELEPTSKLLTQKAFLERVEAYLGAEERGHHVAFAVIDVSGFKRINETYGHPAADKALAGIGGVLDSIWDYRPPPQPDERRHYTGRTPFHVATRLGDEFFFFAPEVRDVDECEGLAKRVYREVEKLRILEIENTPLSIDIGIICVPLPPLSERFAKMPDVFTAVIRMRQWADSLMLSAKHYSKTQENPTASQHISSKFMRFNDLLEKSRNEKQSPPAAPQ